MLDGGLPVEVVLVDRPCGALGIAQGYGVRWELAERKSFGRSFDRQAFTRRVTARLCDHNLDLLAMAGFGTVLGAELFEAYPGRVLNTHPALLPAFRGWHAVEDALAAGVKVTGCTVHVATPDVDAGAILAQEAVIVEPDDTPERLHERIKVVERRLYPATVRSVLASMERVSR